MRLNRQGINNVVDLNVGISLGEGRRDKREASDEITEHDEGTNAYFLG